jgi:molybdenum cofactor synthesis domain-containing protein
MNVAVITISDTVARGERADASGPAVAVRCAYLRWSVVATEILPDDTVKIQAALKRLSEADLILTTGGTGVGPRDVTPEATLAIAEATRRNTDSSLAGEVAATVSWLTADVWWLMASFANPAKKHASYPSFDAV